MWIAPAKLMFNCLLQAARRKTGKNMAIIWLAFGSYAPIISPIWFTYILGRLMAAYLDTSKIQAAGRLSLSPSALRNLKVAAGDTVDIFFNEELGCLLIVPVKNEDPCSDAKGSIQNGEKAKT